MDYNLHLSILFRFENGKHISPQQHALHTPGPGQDQALPGDRLALLQEYSHIEEEVTDLERVQKVACKIILQDNYLSYEEALEDLNLQPLSERRHLLCLKFAKKCLKHEKAKDMFPLNNEPRNEGK